MLEVRFRPVMTKAKGEPWVLGGLNDPDSKFSMVKYEHSSSAMLIELQVDLLFS